MQISDIEFNKASFELSKFEEMLVKNREENKEALLEKKLELIYKHNELLDDEDQVAFIKEYGAYLSGRIKENKLEAYM